MELFSIPALSLKSRLLIIFTSISIISYVGFMILIKSGFISIHKTNLTWLLVIGLFPYCISMLRNCNLDGEPNKALIGEYIIVFLGLCFLSDNLSYFLLIIAGVFPYYLAHESANFVTQDNVLWQSLFYFPNLSLIFFNFSKSITIFFFSNQKLVPHQHLSSTSSEL